MTRSSRALLLAQANGHLGRLQPQSPPHRQGPCQEHVEAPGSLRGGRVSGPGSIKASPCARLYSKIGVVCRPDLFLKVLLALASPGSFHNYLCNWPSLGHTHLPNLQDWIIGKAIESHGDHADMSNATSRRDFLQSASNNCTKSGRHVLLASSASDPEILKFHEKLTTLPWLGFVKRLTKPFLEGVSPCGEAGPREFYRRGFTWLFTCACGLGEHHTKGAMLWR